MGPYRPSLSYVEMAPYRRWNCSLPPVRQYGGMDHLCQAVTQASPTLSIHTYIILTRYDTGRGSVGYGPRKSLFLPPFNNLFRWKIASEGSTDCWLLDNIPLGWEFSPCAPSGWKVLRHLGVVTPARNNKGCRVAFVGIVAGIDQSNEKYDKCDSMILTPTYPHQKNIGLRIRL